MADIDGQADPEKKGLHACGVRMAKRERPQFLPEPPPARLSVRPGLDPQGRLPADAYQRAAPGARMGAEDLFAGLGEQGASRGLDALGLSPQKPKTAFIIHGAAVAHPVPYSARRGG